MTDWVYWRPKYEGHAPPSWADECETQLWDKWYEEWSSFTNPPTWCRDLRYRFKPVETPATPPRCDACTFFDRGECKRYPPIFFPPPSYQKVYPRVEDYDWCGEFKPKELTHGSS